METNEKSLQERDKRRLERVESNSATYSNGTLSKVQPEHLDGTTLLVELDSVPGTKREPTADSLPNGSVGSIDSVTKPGAELSREDLKSEYWRRKVAPKSRRDKQ